MSRGKYSRKKESTHNNSNLQKDNVSSIQASDVVLEDFVIDKLDEDLVFLSNSLQLILGPKGYKYCLSNSEELEREYQKDRLATFAKNDNLKLYQLNTSNQSFKLLRPYGGGSLVKSDDVLSLADKGLICRQGRQVELFHAYLMENLIRRFKKYLYFPSKNIVGNCSYYGPFAHRGYDFLLAITLYLELQLGIHIYIGENNPRDNIENFKSQIINLFKLPEISLPNGMMIFLMDYWHALAIGTYPYELNNDIELYYSAGLYTESQYKEYKKLLLPDIYCSPAQCNYLLYLQYIISATCFNYPGMYAAALYSFPQSDFAKYMCGLDYIIELFEDKITSKEIHISKEEIQRFAENKEVISEDVTHIVSREKIYQDTVFMLMDELNGMFYHVRPQDLIYRDKADINDDDYTINEGKFDVNPARKSTNAIPIRKLKMELYTFLNGKCFHLQAGDTPDNPELRSSYTLKYPILPWVSNGKEDTVHIDCASISERNPEMLFSHELICRQQYLYMEYHLTTIPVNCIEEYLNPDIFFNWKNRNDLLHEIQRQNEELKRHIQLNQELVRSLSHSSANFLNSERLVRTGLALHKADGSNPTIDDLHDNGLELLLQAEQEAYLTRQLDSLVLRCSADIDELTQQIKCGLSRRQGCSIVVPVCFALKSIMARVLFNDNDLRSQFIRSKLFTDDRQLVSAKSSFMLNVLTQNNNEDNMLNWWNANINKLQITYSKLWDNLCIIEKGYFYDLVIEITSELIFNVLSHGNLRESILIEFGQDEGRRGRPSWAYISCHNLCGEIYANGKQKGISTLREMINLINNHKRSISVNKDEHECDVQVWLLASLLKPMSD